MDNLELYNKLRNVPKEAQKPIEGGRLRGKTDINPMWRMKALTEIFGPVGIGWKYTIEKMWLEQSGEEIAAFVNINLYYKYNDIWSEAIPGTGGNMFREKEKNGLYTSDECYKMALTDALSVAAKALGVAADIYWEADKTKYTADKPETATVQKHPVKKEKTQAQHIAELIDGSHLTGEDIAGKIKADYKKSKVNDLTPEEFKAFYLETREAIKKFESEIG